MEFNPTLAQCKTVTELKTWAVRNSINLMVSMEACMYLDVLGSEMAKHKEPIVLRFEVRPYRDAFNGQTTPDVHMVEFDRKDGRTFGWAFCLNEAGKLVNLVPAMPHGMDVVMPNMGSTH